MAYANYRYKGHNFIGEVHGEHLIPLAGLTDVGPETSAELLASAARLTESRVALSETTLRAASPRAGKILCVGLNYKGHAGEACTAAFPSSSPSTHPPSSDPATTSSCLRNPPRSTLKANSPSSSARQVAASPNRTPWTTSLAIASPTTSPCATARTSPTNGCRARSGTTPHRLAPTSSASAEADIRKADISTTLNGEVVAMRWFRCPPWHHPGCGPPGRKMLWPLDVAGGDRQRDAYCRLLLQAVIVRLM